MDDRLKKLNDIKIENFIWVIYIGIILLSWYANDQRSKKEYQNLLIFIFTILVLVYYYFAKDSYDSLQNINEDDSDKKKGLLFSSFIGSVLILISGIIFLGIAILDEEIDVEIAFN